MHLLQVWEERSLKSEDGGCQEDHALVLDVQKPGQEERNRQGLLHGRKGLLLHLPLPQQRPGACMEAHSHTGAL